MRILGLRAKDEAMTQAYFEGQDIHKSTASLAFGVAVEDVTKDQRQASKDIAFGLVYGKSEKAQATELRAKGIKSSIHKDKNGDFLPVSDEEVQEIIRKYFASKPAVEQFINDTHAFVEKYGYVETMQGHRRLLKGIWTKDKKNDALRQSVNSVVQGTGAYLTNTAIIYIDDFLQKNNMRSKLVATVHDSIVVDCPPEEIALVASVVKFLMSNLPIPFLQIEWNGQMVQYPIDAETEIGVNYKDAVGFDEEDFKTFKSIKGYADYHKALAKFEDYADSKVITKEQMEEGQAAIRASKVAYQAME